MIVVELCKCCFESGRSVVEKRSTGAMAWTRRARSAGRNEGFNTLPRERHPSHFNCDETGSVVIHMQCVFAAEINGFGSRGIHNKGCWRRPDERVYGAAGQ